MPTDKLAHCRSLLDSGREVAALVALIRLKAEGGIGDEAVAPLLSTASQRCGDKYDSARDEVLGLIRGCGCMDTVAACLEIFSRFQDYATLKACRDIPVGIDPSLMFRGFADFVDSHLTTALAQGRTLDLGPATLAGAAVRRALPGGASPVLSRDAGQVTTPLRRGGKRIELGTRVWAVVFDAESGAYVASLSEGDRVIRVNARTLETEKVIDSPAPGVRGVAIHPRRRRGFFTSEFGNAMFSFDLDRFEIRTEIRGFSVRPERVRVDAATDTVVTGNLGLEIYFPTSVFRQKLQRQCSQEGKAADGASITVVDAAGETVTATLPAGRRPTAVGISARHMAAGNFYDNTVTVYDRDNPGDPLLIALDGVADIPFPFTLEDPASGQSITHSRTLRPRLVEGIAILDRRGWILVSGFDACILTIIHIGRRKVIAMVAVQDCPFDVVADEDEKFAYVSCRHSDQVSVVDLDAGLEVARLATGPQPADLSLWGHTLLVPDDSGFSILDVSPQAAAAG